MNVMRSHEDLEIRLGRIDLQLQGQGKHLEPERLACIANGSEPTDEEAAHLVGCDECTDLLIALGSGLEALSNEEPELAVMFAERPVFAPKKPVHIGIVVGGLCLAAGAMAAAGWAVHSFSAKPTEAVAPKGQVIERFESTIETSPVIQPSEPIKEQSLVPATVEPREFVEQTSEAAPRPPTAKLKTKPTAKTQTAKSSEIDSRLPQLEEKHLSGREGRRLMERIPVNGAARGFGQLRLNSKPAARIWIDGKDRGWTPIIDLRLQAGPHDVKLVYESPLADKKEERFRVLIQADQTWSAIRNNHRDPTPANK